jgi:23S rRNA (pseudouridine1915-N3)-methyltransferase
LLKLRIVAVGKDKQSWVSDGISHYLKLLSKYADVEIQPLADTKAAASLSPGQVKAKQAARLKKEIGKGLTIALSDSGQEYDSIAFSKLLERAQVTSGGTVTFLIGGPYGLDDSILRRADYVLSLSRLTFSHRVVRLVLLEQLYRGFTILAGTDYHK